MDTEQNADLLGRASAGDAPLCLGEVGRHRKARVNPNHGRQHYDRASLPDVQAMPPVLPGPPGCSKSRSG